jgi:hypothetical protein
MVGLPTVARSRMQGERRLVEAAGVERERNAIVN